MDFMVRYIHVLIFTYLNLSYYVHRMTYVELILCNISLKKKQKKTKENIYKDKTSILKVCGHCLRRDDEVVSDLVLWEPIMELEDGEGHHKATSGISSAKLVYRRAR